MGLDHETHNLASYTFVPLQPDGALASWHCWTLYVLNFEPHKPAYKISIEVGRSVVNSENTTHDYSPHAKAFGNYMHACTIVPLKFEKTHAASCLRDFCMIST